MVEWEVDGEVRFCATYTSGTDNIMDNFLLCLFSNDQTEMCRLSNSVLQLYSFCS